MNSLKVKTISGIKWSTVSQVGRQGIQLITSIILAQLLSPSDFGLLGMAMVVIGFIGIFKDLGTSAAVIQRQEISDSLLSSLFWINVVFGLFVSIILIIAAPLVGSFFNDQRVVSVLQVLALSFLISSVGILQKALLERTLSFKPLSIIEIVSSIAGAIVGILMAVNNFGVWSLVYQSLSSTLLSTVLLWVTSSWRFKLLFKLEEVKKVMDFGLNLIGFNTLNYFSRNADNILIGRYLGAQSLGFYSLAYNILLISSYLVTGIISRVLFPVYSLMQDDNRRLSVTYLKITSIIAFLSFPLMTGIFVLAKPLVLVIFGLKWEPIIPLVMIFAPIGLLQSIGATIGSIYQAKGRTDLMFRWGIISSIVVVTGFVIGLKWGFLGVALSYLITTLILIVPSFYWPFKLINLKIPDFFGSLIPYLLNSVIMLFVLLLIMNFIFVDVSDPGKLFLLVIIGSIVYVMANWITNRKWINEIFALVFLKEHQDD